MKKRQMTYLVLQKDIENGSKSVVKDHFVVRVGIKTTADKVFIGDKWEELNGTKPEDDLLLIVSIILVVSAIAAVSLISVILIKKRLRLKRQN